MNKFELGISTAGSITNPEKTFALAEQVRRDLKLPSIPIEGYAFTDSVPYKILRWLHIKSGKLPVPAPLTAQTVLAMSEKYPDSNLIVIHDAFDYNLSSSLWTALFSGADPGTRLQHALWPILMGTVSDAHARKMVRGLNSQLPYHVDLSIHADSAALLVTSGRTGEVVRDIPGGVIVDPAITYRSPVFINGRQNFLYDPLAALNTFIVEHPKAFKGLAVATDHLQNSSIKPALDVVTEDETVRQSVFSVHVAEPRKSAYHGICNPGSAGWDRSHTKRVIDTLKELDFDHRVLVIVDADQRSFGKLTPEQQRVAIRELAEYLYS